MRRQQRRWPGAGLIILCCRAMVGCRKRYAGAGGAAGGLEKGWRMWVRGRGQHRDADGPQWWWAAHTSGHQLKTQGRIKHTPNSGYPTRTIPSNIRLPRMTQLAYAPQIRAYPILWVVDHEYVVSFPSWWCAHCVPAHHPDTWKISPIVPATVSPPLQWPHQPCYRPLGIYHWGLFPCLTPKLLANRCQPDP